MTEKKAKKTIKVCDLEPAKDARGGHRRHRSLLNQREGEGLRQRAAGGIHQIQ